MFVVREEDRLADIRRKTKIINTIIFKCGLIANNPEELANPLAATVFLTNQSRKIIEEALKDPKTRERKSLIESYQDLKSKVAKSSILRCNIHDILYENYVNKRHVFKLQDVYSELKKFNVIENQLHILKSRGYIWKRLRGDKCILVEDPEVQAKRMKYLLDMKKFREDNRTFVHVEEKAIPADAATLTEFQNNYHSPQSGTYEYIKIALSPQMGVIAFSIHTTPETFTEWLKKEVSPHLKKSFVLVMDEKTIKESPVNQPPNPEAKKEDMVYWLERNNIPCSSTMHRAELYELIDLYKDKVSGEKTFTDEVFKANGVEVLKRPDGWPMLNYLQSVWGIIDIWNPTQEREVADVVKKRIEMVMNTRDLVKFQQYDNDLEAIETELYEKDMELEEVTDKLFTMARDVDIPDVGLTNYWELKGNDLEKYVTMMSGALDQNKK